ncbi:MAG: MBL fold metallo-hydrolase [Nitrospinae bacterium]|nr:MBL fold metallo-hydrolase [Nitrospinota bacterium]
MVENIKWLGHATFRITGEKKIYIDPWKIKDKDEADIILISHSHYDHLSVPDVEKVQGDNSVIITTTDSVSKLSGKIRTLLPREKVEVDGVIIEGVSSYNVNKKFHPKSNNWLGFIININKKRIYYAGDTDYIPEMRDLMDIDIALLPVGGTYTMTGEEAANAANVFKPRLAIPSHWGDIVGSRKDAESFKRLFKGETEIL